MEKQGRKTPLSYPVNKKAAMNNGSGTGPKQNNSGNSVKQKSKKTLKMMQKGLDSTECRTVSYGKEF